MEKYICSILYLGMKTIILYGVRRSGNHFILSTILQNYPNHVHMNDIDLSYELYIKYATVEKTCNRIDNKYTGFKNVDCVILSIENKEINFRTLELFQQVEHCYPILLLRCPYSNFSSVWKVYGKNKSKLTDIITLWKKYANIFVDTNNSFIKILYDEYSKYDNYMMDVFKRLELPVDITNIQKEHSIIYQESSFKNKNEARQVYTTIDTCIFKDDPTFTEIVGDKEIADLWETVKTTHLKGI